MKIETTTSYRIKKHMEQITDLLVRKNNQYGDSATKPAKIFNQLGAVESICCRIDDKMMRIKNKGLNKNTYDTLDDLVGYFVLLKIAIEDAENEKENQ